MTPTPQPAEPWDGVPQDAERAAEIHALHMKTLLHRLATSEHLNEFDLGTMRAAIVAFRALAHLEATRAAEVAEARREMRVPDPGRSYLADLLRDAQDQRIPASDLPEFIWTEAFNYVEFHQNKACEDRALPAPLPATAGAENG